MSVHKIFFLPLFFWANVFLFSQTSDQVTKVDEFVNQKQSGSLFYTSNMGPDGVSGNGIVFREDGIGYIFQTDQGLLYSYNTITKKITYLFKLDLAGYEGINSATSDYILFTGGFGSSDSYSYSGKKIFSIRLSNDVTHIRTEGFFYHANILFFIDDKNKLYSILSPSMDQETNEANFRDPEQTIKLFEPGSGIDLQGLTMDEKGQLFLNGLKYYWPGTVVGKYKYQILDNDNVYISDGEKKIRIYTKTDNSSEFDESTAIHPSGDIYFLKYNKNTDKHILYRIENTWDPAFRAEWYRKAAARETADAAALKATANDNNVRIRKQPTLTGTEVGKLQKGNVVTVLEKSSQPMKIDTMNAYWYRIKTDAGLEGWSYGAFLDIQK